MPEELQQGASFSDIALDGTDAETEVEATPEPVAEDVAQATEETVESESETLGILKEEEEAQEEDDKPDLSIDPELEKHPILKAKWEAYKAQKEKGIDKFIQSHKDKIEPLEEFKATYEPLADFYQQFEDPETVDEAFAAMCSALEKTYGRAFGSHTVQPSAQEGESQSKYGLEFASDDKVVDVVLREIKGLLGQEIAPLKQDYEAKTRDREASARASQAIPALKREYEVSTDPWITPELVREAIDAYPGIAPDKAFAAHYAKRIAQYAVKHSPTSSKPQVRNLPQGASGGRSRTDLTYGAGFGDIAESEAVSL